MKPFPPVQIMLMAVCIAIWLLQSCVTVPGSWKNDRISAGKREDFHALNTSTLQYLKANGRKGLKTLLSKKLADSVSDQQVTSISKKLKANQYELLDEYYVVNRYADIDTVPIQNGDIKRYALIYPYVTTQMYLAFFAPKIAGNTYLLSLMYGKFDSGWKIVKMELGPYTVNGKTAPELFALAKDESDKKYYQAALTNVTLANSCMKPSSTWHYPEEQDAAAFYDRIKGFSYVAYRFPMLLKQLPSAPMILNVDAQNTDNGSYPLVLYMTHYSVKDTAAVKKENIEIQKSLAKLMPGLGEGSNFIMYSAFNQDPTRASHLPHFDMKQKLN
jgi:hypothetical protein